MVNKLFTSESVTEGHPDKVADQISDAVLDDILQDDPQARVACETFVATGLVLVGGEITTQTWVNVPKIARRIIKEVGYTKSEYGFNWEDCAILTTIDEQSPDISSGVTKSKEVRNGLAADDEYELIGAGDQGIMYGYACRETDALMPLPIHLAHGLTKRLAEVRKKNIFGYLRPDGKSQVTIEYKKNKPIRAHTVLIAAQHSPDVSIETLTHEIAKEVVEPIVGDWMDDETNILINTSGRFVIGGPPSDTGMTGRKIIIDSYGGYGSHGGGAFSGKDPTKVDRSASYMARYVAKNIVAAELARECEVQVTYAIGMAHPISITVNTYGTGKVAGGKLEEMVKKNFDFRPGAIIDKLNLREPIYRDLACYGHFGREDLGVKWEVTDKVEALKASV